MVLKLNEEAVFREFDGDARSRRVSCEVVQGESSFHCLVPRDVSELLHQFDGTRTIHEVVGAFCQDRPGASRQKLTRLIENYFVPNGVLLGSGPPAVAVTARVTSKPHYVRFRVPLLRTKAIRALVSPLGVLFSRSCLCSLLVATIAAHLAFYSTHNVWEQIDITTLPLSDAAIIIAIILLSAFVHELGHAAALVRHGGNAREIGFAVYLMRPVLYTNVSESWRLTRWQRIQVDVGGMYFQSIFLLMLCAASGLFTSRAIEFSFVWIDLLVVTALNPVLRMDGYWLLADLAGSSGLREESVGALRDLLFSFAGRSRIGGQLPARKRVFLTVYAVVSVCVFAWIYWYFAGVLGTVMLPQYPRLLNDVAVGLKKLNVVEVTRALVILVWTTMLIVAFTGLVVNAARRVAALVRSFPRAELKAGAVEKGREI